MPRRRNAVTKNFKDYLVPGIVGFIIIVIIFSLFSGGEDTQDVQKENRVGILIEKDTQGAAGTIEYLNGDKTEITGQVSLFKSETIKVTNGNIQLDIPEVGDGMLSKLGVLVYKENGSFGLESGNLWLNVNQKQTVGLEYAQVRLAKNTNISLSQNEVSSVVYVINGSAEVTNLGGKSTTVVAGEKLSVSRLDASSEDVDLKANKEPIDDYFKQSDWYVLNKGDSYINANNNNQDDKKENSTDDNQVLNSSRVLLFDAIKDQANIGESSIKISGKYMDDSIVKITANNKTATLDTQNATFSFEGIDTSAQVNDIIFRAYDDSGDVIERKLITLYFQGGSEGSTAGYNLQNYEEVDASQYTFTGPSTNNVFSTTNGQITIYGKVLNPEIASVTVNGYNLKSYSQANGTWRYHAFTDYETLKNGTNEYEVKYFDANNNFVYSNVYTIVKK